MIEEYNKSGIQKVNNNICKLIILSILAGMFIALAGAISVYASYSISLPSVAKLVMGLLFPVGLILVILMKTELFTGNMLLIIPIIKKKIKINQLLNNWLWVYIGNFIGSIIVALVIYYAGNVEANDLLFNKFASISVTKTSLTFINAMILGIFCNILVCVAVYLAFINKDTISKIFCIFIPIMVFIILGFEHSVANMFYLSMGYLTSEISICDALFNNLLPVTIGNIIGGFLVGFYILYANKEKKNK